MASSSKLDFLRTVRRTLSTKEQRSAKDRLRLLGQMFVRGAFEAGLSGPYTLVLPQAQRVFTPWYARAFGDEVYEPIRDRTLLRPDTCYVVRSFVEHARQLPGAMAECGVYRGGSAHVIASTLRKAGSKVPLHLFDTFAGMPSSANAAYDGHVEGDLGDTSLDSVKKLLAPFDGVHFHPGLIPDTFKGLPETTWSFVHIDVDIYRATLDSLAYFYPRTERGGVFLFDDYGYRIHERAEKRAVDEFFADKPEKPIVLQTGQAFVLKV